MKEGIAPILTALLIFGAVFLACPPLFGGIATAHRHPIPAFTSQPGHPSDRMAQAAQTPRSETPTEFVATTPRQEELREIITRALGTQDEHRAVAALITLMETEEMSNIKASGMMMLAELYFNEGNHDRCLQILDALVAAAPPMGEFEYVYGGLLVEMSRFEEAVPHLTRAIELNPDILVAYALLASIHTEAQREQEAAAILAAYQSSVERLLEIAGDTNQDLMTRITALSQFGQTPADDEVTRALGALLSEDNVMISEAIIRILAQVGTHVAAPIVETYASQTSHEGLRELALVAVQVITAQAADSTTQQ